MGNYIDKKLNFSNILRLWLSICLLLVCGCQPTVPLTDKLPANVPKGFVEFYLAANIEMPATAAIRQISNGESKLLGKIGSLSPQQRFAIRPGHYKFIVELGTAQDTVEVDVYEGMVTPIGVLVTVTDKHRTLEAIAGNREYYKMTYHYNLDLAEEAPINFDDNLSKKQDTKKLTIGYPNHSATTFKLDFEKELKCRGWIRNACFHPNGVYIASVDDDHSVKIWDIQSSTCVLHLESETKKCFNTIAFSQDGKLIGAVCKDIWFNVICVWDSLSGEVLQTINTGQEADIIDICFSANGKFIISVGNDNALQLWDVRTGLLKKALIGHRNPVCCVAFSPDGSNIASGSQDKTVKLWDSETGKPRKTLSGHSSAIESLDFSPDGNNIVSCESSSIGSDKVIIWDVATGQAVVTKKFTHPRRVAFSSKGDHIAVGDAYGDIYIIDAKTGEQNEKIKSHKNLLGVVHINAVDFSPDNKRMLSAADDDVIKIWHLKNE